jgi:hypothetical protein
VTIEEIIQMTENRLAFLQQHREYAFGRGDMTAVTDFDAEILTTQETLHQLRTLVP